LEIAADSTGRRVAIDGHEFRRNNGLRACDSARPESALIIMLVRLTAAAAAIALLAHSLLGCCWHHQHAGCIGHERACLHAAPHAHHHAEHSRPAAAEPQHDDEDSEHRHHTGCVEPNCSFVGADAPQLIDVPLTSPAASIGEATVCRCAGRIATGISAPIDRESLSTARMRAVLQIWVV
jgi:hypothetical protein